MNSNDLQPNTTLSPVLHKAGVIGWKAFPQVKPNSAGWYLVCVQEVNDLGISSYVDVISYAHSAVDGDYWKVEHGGVVVAWAEVEKPSFL